jgi:hypothetical protein
MFVSVARLGSLFLHRHGEAPEKIVLEAATLTDTTFPCGRAAVATELLVLLLASATRSVLSYVSNIILISPFD